MKNKKNKNLKDSIQFIILMTKVVEFLDVFIEFIEKF